MKTAFTTSLKDDVAGATLMLAAFIAIIGSIVSSNDARADKAPYVKMQQMEVQKMETILITAPRHTGEATKFLVASR